MNAAKISSISWVSITYARGLALDLAKFYRAPFYIDWKQKDVFLPSVLSKEFTQRLALS